MYRRDQRTNFFYVGNTALIDYVILEKKTAFHYVSCKTVDLNVLTFKSGFASIFLTQIQQKY